MNWSKEMSGKLSLEYFRLDLICSLATGQEYNEIRYRMFRLQDACQYLYQRQQRKATAGRATPDKSGEAS